MITNDTTKTITVTSHHRLICAYVTITPVNSHIPTAVNDNMKMVEEIQVGV